MKKLLFILTGILLCLQQGQAQRQTWTENFDGALPPAGWTVSSSSVSGSWQPNTTYFQPDLSGTNIQSYRGKVPGNPGDFIVLTTPVYDCRNFNYVYLRFSHICKVSPSDSVRIEYRTDGIGTWNLLPGSNYLGPAINYWGTGFNALSYPQWRADDSLALPAQSWWKEELFDLTDIAGIAQVEFRFIIKHGNVPGTQVSYGWLLDNFHLEAAEYDIYPPTVEFLPPYVRDTLYSTGPYEIQAKVKTNTDAPIKTPYLKWTTDNITYDSVLMTMVQGDSLWKADIPKYLPGTTVTYSVTGTDSLKNTTTIVSGYVITMGASGNDVVIQDNGIRSAYDPPFVYEIGYSRCMLIYPLDEIGPQAAGTITSISLRVAQAGQGSFPAKIYMKTVPAAKRSWNITDDNYDWITATQGATLVYDGMLSFTTTGWVDIPLQQSFFYNRQENLVLLFEQNCESNYGCISAGYMDSYPTYYHKVTPEVRQWTRSYNNPLSPNDVKLQFRSVDLRLRVTPASFGSNAVAVKNILSPVQTNVTGGQPVPVKVVISNKRAIDLDSCLVYWSVNGVVQPYYTWTGNLPWDYEDTLVLGNYTSGIGRYDTLAVWVSLPNGRPDSITWDDTLITVLYSCSGPLAGGYTVGTGMDFPAIEDAMKAITLCGANADIRLLLSGSVYSQTWDFRDYDFGNITGNHTLTLASATGNRDDVVVRPSSGVALHLGNTRNMGFDGITFDARTTGSVAVLIDRSCSNLAINNCSLLGDTNGVATLYVALPAGEAIDNFRFTNSLVDGGLYGVMFIGGTPGWTGGISNTNVVFDSNIFQNATYCNVDISATHVISFSHNKIYGKISSGSPFASDPHDWYGLKMRRCNMENMTGNTFLQRTSQADTSRNIKAPCAMELEKMNSPTTPIHKPIFIANNEIMLPFVDDGYTGYGMRILSSGCSDGPILVLHNSIRVAGKPYSSQTGIYTDDWTGLHVIKNNSIHTLGEESYPIQLGSVFNPNLIDLDANNMYAPNYIGWIRQIPVPSIQDWQQYITTDKSSVSIKPDYIDSSKSLELNDYSGLTCFRDPKVIQDIRGTERGGTTGLGCYTSPCPQVDAALGDILGIKRSGHASAGQQDTIKVELINAGWDPITSVTLCWKINGVAQTSPAPWPGNLGTGDKTEVTLGILTYGYGDNTVEAYICGLGSQEDPNQGNDTVQSSSSYVCRAPLSGTYSVGGVTGPRNYAGLNAFADAVDTCGATGTITLAFTGLYNGTLDFTEVAHKLQGIPVIVTGATGNDTIHALSGNAVTIGEGNRNITLKDITIRANETTGRCINITGACTNLVVRNCNLLASTATTSDGACIYKGEGTGMWDSITITGNRLDGGVYNACFYGGNSESRPYPDLVVFDSNSCTNAYRYGIYAYYSNVQTTYNEISCRVSGAMTADWCPVYYEYSNGNITGNRITALPSARAKTGPVMRLIYVNYTNAMGPMFVSNNEIRYLGTNRSSNGIYITNPGHNAPFYVVHNSIYMEGSGSSRGIYASNISRCIIKNNTIHMLASGAYPVYISGFNAATMGIDANNMYAPTNVGYVGTAITSLAAWQRIVTTDTRSVRVLPSYTDISSSLALNNYDSMLCPQFPGCSDDLLQSPRKPTTAMGAYTPPLLGFDLKNQAITNVPATVLQYQTLTVKVNVMGFGDTLVQNATFGWSLNGITQPPPPMQTFTPALNGFETAEVSLGTFTVNDSITNIVVWIEQVNGKKDNNPHNDTARMVLNRVPLVEYVFPFVEDTINRLSFNVYAGIYEHTGATVPPPQMHIHTTVNGLSQLYDSVTMKKEGTIWVASVPKQYYGSKVVYTLHISDSIGNTITLADSTHIIMDLSQNYLYSSPSDSLTGITWNSGIVVNNSADAWSRTLYKYSQITNHNPLMPVYIYGIAYRAATASGTRMIRIYMKATTQSTHTDTYLNPVVDTATLVYQGPIHVNDIAWLDLPFAGKPFLLPAKNNLLVYVEEYGGTTTSINWRGSSTMYGENYYGSERTGFMVWGMPGATPVTRFTVGGIELYSGNNLAVLNVASPVNNPDELCVSDYAPVKITLANLSEDDYSFVTNPIEAGVRVVNPLGHDTVYTGNITGGTLPSGETDTVEIVPAIPVMYSGQYDIKAWISSPVDNIVYDDTIGYTYLSGRVGLPIDEDFNGNNLPFQFVSQPLIGTNTWMPYQPDTNVFPIKPQFGTGMLRYGGNQGTMARLLTRQLDIYGTVNPKLEFWYYHDTAISSMDESYTEVNIITAGVSTTVLSVPKKSSTYGWTQYTMYLSPYIGSMQCLLIEFVSTNDNKSGLQSEQYIDRILITSDQELEVSEIIITPEITACGLENKNIYAVVRTATNHAIDFSQYPTSLAVDIPGYATFNSLLQGIMQGNTSDTVLIASNIDLAPGISNMKAYLTVPVDYNPLNDTASLLLDIHPAISLTAQPISGGMDCLLKGTPVQQNVTVKNTGNVEVPGIELLLNVMASSQQSLAKSAGSLNPGDSAIILFDAYTVPADADYQVQVTGYMGCDSALVNSGTSVSECVDIHDLVITRFVKPQEGETDTTGKSNEIAVYLKNFSDVKDYTDVVITALVEVNGIETASYREIISKVEILDSMLYTFTAKYTVPNETEYAIRLFINSEDNYPVNDTLLLKREAIDGDVGIRTDESGVFTIKQNIPNPAGNSTVIEYSVPQSGEVIFRIHSMNGQILYNKVIESGSGDQSVEINTSGLSSGVYMYSMEYRGQRIVKRMSVKR